jgi:hypothetical protein
VFALSCCVQSHGPWYDVETGRRDGNVSVAEYAANDLAPPDSNIVDVKTFFSVKSLSSKDIAVLFGSYLSTCLLPPFFLSSPPHISCSLSPVSDSYGSANYSADIVSFS